MRRSIWENVEINNRVELSEILECAIHNCEDRIELECVVIAYHVGLVAYEELTGEAGVAVA